MTAVSKARLVFHLFDSNKSGKISKGEILDVLRYMVGANIGAENLEAIAERCLVEVNNMIINQCCHDVGDRCWWTIFNQIVK